MRLKDVIDRSHTSNFKKKTGTQSGNTTEEITVYCCKKEKGEASGERIGTGKGKGFGIKRSLFEYRLSEFHCSAASNVPCKQHFRQKIVIEIESMDLKQWREMARLPEYTFFCTWDKSRRHGDASFADGVTDRHVTGPLGM